MSSHRENFFKIAANIYLVAPSLRDERASDAVIDRVMKIDRRMA